jgi:hypothetical protein
MGKNVREWTKDVLGVEMTPQQFLDSPEAQEAVFRQKAQELWDKYGNPEDVASVWHSGVPRTQAIARHRHDKNMSTEHYSDIVGSQFRTQRASGGSVRSPHHEFLVDRLMRSAKDAKKVTDKTTEPLLNVPDEHIVKALDVAQRAI